MDADEARGLTPEQALDLARSAATTARELSRMAGEQFAEALTRYNQAGGEFRYAASSPARPG